MAMEVDEPICPDVASLVAMVDRPNPFDYDPAEMLPRQLRAADQRFKQRVGQIKLLNNRAETGGIEQVTKTADLVPLLFAHTAYKSYPESWLFEGKWDRMSKWLGTVCVGDFTPIEEPVSGLDEWLAALEEQGHFVGCSSGTTGKCSLMNATWGDIVFGGKTALASVRNSGVEASQDRIMIGLGQVARTARNTETGKPMMAAFIKPGSVPFMPDVPAITVGKIMDMVLLRRKMADGTAQASDIERFERESAQRQKDSESAVAQVVEATIARRHEKLHFGGMYPSIFSIANVIRERGFTKADFQQNTAFIAGGLKRANLPDDFREVIADTLNISNERIVMAYSMQELNTSMPRCSAGRYHMPPWLMLLLLDESGEKLLEPVPEGEQEGRAAFFDISLEARWGGVISGDKVRATWAPCACGNRSPSIGQDIQRYADLESGDKIACSGTIDAYVRGGD
jgi:hypothetical protein